MSKIKIIVALAPLALSACGGSETPAAGGSEAAQAMAGRGASAMPANWKATDACSILDKADVGAILKTQVTEAKLDLVHEPGAADAGTSQCTYKLASGGEATLMTRWSPIGDNTAETIAATRSASAASVKAFTSRPIEDVPGVGKAAFLVPGINQFNVFIDDARLIMISPGSVPDAEAKAAVIALAKKAGA